MQFLNDLAVYIDSRDRVDGQLYLYDQRQFGQVYDDCDANFARLGTQLADYLGDTEFTGKIKELHIPTQQS